MKLKLKFVVIVGLGAGLLLAPQVSQAQPAGGRPGRGGPMGPRRAGAKRHLSGLWHGIGSLSGATALSKPQAKRIVGLMNPWMSRPKMTDGQAKLWS